jgi:hypothetical protein
MKRNLARLAVTVGFGSLVLLVGTPTPTLAQVSVNINIGAPPPVIVRSPPTMLLLPEPGFYVAVGVPYDIYFISGRYYYLHEDNWFWAPGYGGPWVHVVHSSLPPGLQKFKIRQLRTFRDREYGLYRAQGPDFKGRRFQAVSGPGGSNGRGNGRGRGH